MTNYPIQGAVVQVYRADNGELKVRPVRKGTPTLNVQFPRNLRNSPGELFRCNLKLSPSGKFFIAEKDSINSYVERKFDFEFVRIMGNRVKVDLLNKKIMLPLIPFSKEGTDIEALTISDLYNMNVPVEKIMKHTTMLENNELHVILSYAEGIKNKVI